MDEYVTKEQVIDLITRRYENPEICTAEINALSAADVAPVKHARWTKNGVSWSCSQCGRSFHYRMEPQWWNYCPQCGDMIDK